MKMSGDETTIENSNSHDDVDDMALMDSLSLGNITENIQRVCTFLLAHLFSPNLHET